MDKYIVLKSIGTENLIGNHLILVISKTELRVLYKNTSSTIILLHWPFFFYMNQVTVLLDPSVPCSLLQLEKQKSNDKNT